jgi:hypothetical protein
MACQCARDSNRLMNRLQTLGADGTRAVSTWSATLQQWQTTVTASPRQTCMGQMSPRTQQVEVRCR